MAAVISLLDLCFGISEHCDLVGLHVLYSVCRDFHDAVTKFVKIKYKKRFNEIFASGDIQVKSAVNMLLYQLKYLPVPGVLFYFSMGNDNMINHLYNNLSFSLIEWYGVENIRTYIKTITEMSVESGLTTGSESTVGSGLVKLMECGIATRDPVELSKLVEFLIDNSLIPKYKKDRMYHVCGNKVAESSLENKTIKPKEEIFYFLISSGNTSLLLELLHKDKIIIPEGYLPKIPEDDEEENVDSVENINEDIHIRGELATLVYTPELIDIIKLAIRSDNVDMVKFIMNMLFN